MGCYFEIGEAIEPSSVLTTPLLLSCTCVEAPPARGAPFSWKEVFHRVFDLFVVQVRRLERKGETLPGPVMASLGVPLWMIGWPWPGRWRKLGIDAWACVDTAQVPRLFDQSNPRISWRASRADPICRTDHYCGVVATLLRRNFVWLNRRMPSCYFHGVTPNVAVYGSPRAG